MKLSSSTVPPSSSVAGSRSASSAVTGRPYSIEVPRSPRASAAEKGGELPRRAAGPARSVRGAPSICCGVSGRSPSSAASGSPGSERASAGRGAASATASVSDRLQRPARPASAAPQYPAAGRLACRLTVHSRRPSQEDSGRMRHVAEPAVHRVHVGRRVHERGRRVVLDAPEHRLPRRRRRRPWLRDRRRRSASPPPDRSSAPRWCRRRTTSPGSGPTATDPGSSTRSRCRSRRRCGARSRPGTRAARARSGCRPGEAAPAPAAPSAAGWRWWSGSMSVERERPAVAVEHAVAVVVGPAARREQPPRLADVLRRSGVRRAVADPEERRGRAVRHLRRAAEHGPHHQPAVEREADRAAHVEVAQDGMRPVAVARVALVEQQEPERSATGPGSAGGPGRPRRAPGWSAAAGCCPSRPPRRSAAG